MGETLAKPTKQLTLKKAATSYENEVDSEKGHEIEFNRNFCELKYAFM